jgi:TldD protein
MNALLLVVLTAGPLAATTKVKDPVMDVMEAELKRAMTLSMPATPESKPEKPYYARCYVTVEDEFGVSANFGSLYPPAGGRSLSIETAVRVGSEKFDNTNFSSGGAGYSFGGRGRFPAEEDLDAIRRSLWLSFDSNYKAAVEAIARKRAFLQANQVKDVIPDWSSVTPEVVIQPREEPPAMNADAWAERVKQASAACRTSKHAHSCTVSFRTRHMCQRFVASDRAAHRFCETKLELKVSAIGQAADGMPVGADFRTQARSEAELPDQAGLLAAVKDTVALLEKKLAAPAAVEDYVGPVLFTGTAASTFFLATLAGPLSFPRENLGQRQQGRLTERLGKHVSITQLGAVDDPTQRTWTSPTGVVVPLFGHFPVDDDGVTPKAITLVKEGVLQSFFMSRIPTKPFVVSNGHARGSQASTGNLFVTTSKPQTLASLKKQLVELAKEEDSDFGLMVSVLPQNLNDRPNGATISLPNLPLLVHRVYADGREELVRGYGFKPTSQRVLKDIVGMGDDPTAVNTEQFGQNVSSVAPSVLVKLLELNRARDDYGKPPALPRPALSVK